MLGWVKEDLDVTDAPLLPLAEVPVPPVELGALLEQDLLILFPGFCLHLRNTRLNEDELGSWSHQPPEVAYFNHKKAEIPKAQHLNVPPVVTLLAQSECPRYWEPPLRRCPPRRRCFWSSR